jgi:hypothetical protein
MEYLGCRALDLSLASTKSVCIVGAAKNLPLALAVRRWRGRGGKGGGREGGGWEREEEERGGA